MRCRNQGREEVLIRDMKSEEIEEVSQIWLSANLEAHDFIPASYWKGNLDLVREELPLAKVRVYEEEGRYETRGHVVEGHEHEYRRE